MSAEKIESGKIDPSSSLRTESAWKKLRRITKTFRDRDKTAA